MPETHPRKSQNNKCRVSIILVTYNNLQDIPACLTSLRPTLGQTDEVIVVDNQSTDGTPALIRENFPWVRLLLSEENAGFGAGCNLGAGVAQGRFLAFLNPDTVVAAGWLDALVQALVSNPDCGLATPKILLLKDPGRINTCGNDINITGLTLCRGMGRPKADFAQNEWVNAVSGAAFIVDRSWFDDLGGFDQEFFLYMEDTDLSLRSRLAGRGCLYVADSVIYHDYRLTFGPRKVFYQERNRCLMLIKNFRATTLWLLFPSLLLAEVITWGYVVLYDRKNWRNKLDACKFIIANHQGIKSAHDRVQALRKSSDCSLIAEHTTLLDFSQTGQGIAQKFAGVLFRPALMLNKFIFSFF